MWDHPAYGKHKAGAGPRTKKQRRLLRDAGELAKAEDRKARKFEKAAAKEAAGPTLHTVNWRA